MGLLNAGSLVSSRVENGYQPNSVSCACHVQINSIYKSMSISVYISEEYVKLIYWFSISDKVDSFTFSLVHVLCGLLAAKPDNLYSFIPSHASSPSC